MLEDNTFIATFGTMALIIIILAFRSICFRNELDDLKKTKAEFNKFKLNFVNEWTRTVMEDVDDRIKEITRTSEQKPQRGKGGKFVKKDSGENQPAIS